MPAVNPQPINHPRIVAFLNQSHQWRAEFMQLRALVLACGLTEAFKWGAPCYLLDDRNIVLMHGFKHYCALLFFKGALIDDQHNLLTAQVENMQLARQIRFTTVQQIVALADTLQEYVQAAIIAEQAGLSAEFKKFSAYSIPAEFQRQLDANEPLRVAFEGLTANRQRAYLQHFATPKQAKTRAARVAKCLPSILAGQGLHD